MSEATSEDDPLSPTGMLLWCESWWDDTGNPLYAWQALAICLPADLPIPQWVRDYLARRQNECHGSPPAEALMPKANMWLLMPQWRLWARRWDCGERRQRTRSSELLMTDWRSALRGGMRELLPM